MPASMRLLSVIWTWALVLVGTAGAATADQVLLFEELFEDADWSARGWYDGPSMEITAAEHIDGSSHSCVWRWDQPGDIGPSGGGARLHLPPDRRDWHQVRAVLRLNSVRGGVGQADGGLEFWFDGKRIVAAHDVVFRTGQHPDMLIDQFLMTPYFGPGVPHPQSIWIDGLRIYTNPDPGPADTGIHDLDSTWGQVKQLESGPMMATSSRTLPAESSPLSLLCRDGETTRVAR
jgi:hypothetical protein